MSYLFAHFTMDEHEDKESVWFSLSDDGLHWEDIGGDEPVLRSEIGTKGIRDPFIVYDDRLGKYFIIATDLNTSNGCSWGDAVSIGSRSIYVWESEDLISWSDTRLVEVGIEGAGCVWAPEAVYCKEQEAWFVFWASCVKEPDDKAPKHRIYGSYTKDFKSFTPAFKYMEADKDVIDTDIVFDNGRYYRFSKDETNKCVIIESSESLIPEGKEGYERIHSEVLDNLEGVEGPEAYFLEEQGKWCLIVDCYRARGGYMPLVTDDISTGDFRILPEGSYNLGKRKKRHGGVISIPAQLAENLRAHFGLYK